MDHGFKFEGRRNYKSEIVVDVRFPGVGWAQPASRTMSEQQVLKLISELQDALNQSQNEDAE